MVKLRSAAIVALSFALLAPPAAAQEPATSSVLFDGVGFTFDAALGDGVAASRVPFVAAVEGSMDPAVPEHLRLTTYVAPRKARTIATVEFYEISQLADAPETMATVERLRTLLAGRPDPAVLADDPQQLPKMGDPDSPALRARVAYVDQPGLSGVVYLGYDSLVADLLDPDLFAYVFHGLSDDGRWYVKASISPKTELLPTYGMAAQRKAVRRITRTEQAYDAYIAESRTTLEEATPDAFTPSLSSLDDLIATIVVPGEVPAPIPSPAG